MNEFDNFCGSLLEESKRFLEKAKEEKSAEGKEAYQHACLLLAMCSLEAYINGIVEEMCLSPKMPIHIKAILLEKEMKLEKGEFNLTNSLKMSKLTDRIEILYKRYNKVELNDSENWWRELKSGIDLRNKITHPKEKVKITNELLSKLLQAILDCLSSIYLAVYKRKFPKSNLSLTSRYDF